jgi:probable rRNA maturation factor
LSPGKLDLSVQFAMKESGAPSSEFIAACAEHALAGADGEVAIRIVDESESAMGPTNVLAFPAGGMPPGADVSPLGDVVICAPVVAREAAEQRKPLEAHWAHIIIHGCLHLRGYDHAADAQARQMERRERDLLAELGIEDPYRGES